MVSGAVTAFLFLYAKVESIIKSQAEMAPVGPTSSNSGELVSALVKQIMSDHALFVE